MREIEIPLPADANAGSIERLIDESIAGRGLQVTLRGSLKKYTGCIHWHLQRPGISGTLEITFWPGPRRAWFSIQDGRAAPWVEDEMHCLVDLLQRRLNGD